MRGRKVKFPFLSLTFTKVTVEKNDLNKNLNEDINNSLTQYFTIPGNFTEEYKDNDSFDDIQSF